MSYRGVLGVDPGMTGTGLVACLVDVNRVNVGSDALRVAARVTITPPGMGSLYHRTARMQDQLVDRLKDFGALLHGAGYDMDSLEVAVEDPSRFTPLWHTGRPRSRTSTAGRLGVALGICLASVRSAGFRSVTCYEVKDWWPRTGQGNRYDSHASVVDVGRRLWPALEAATEHEVISARLCVHHVMASRRREALR